MNDRAGRVNIVATVWIASMMAIYVSQFAGPGVTFLARLLRGH